MKRYPEFILCIPGLLNIRTKKRSNSLIILCLLGFILFSVGFVPLKTSAQYEERINLFTSTNENGRAYDRLETKAQRDSFVIDKLMKDWVDTIPYREDLGWICTTYSRQLLINFFGCENCSGYSGMELDSIYANYGTYKDNGKYGLPLASVTISDSGYGHMMNAIITGNNILDWNHWNFIEPQNDSSLIQPGEGVSIPENCNLSIYSPKGGSGSSKLAGFRIENGVPEFAHKSVTGGGVPHPLLIIERDSLNPEIHLNSPTDGRVYDSNPQLEYSILDSTLKEAWYSFNSGKTKNILYQDLYKYTVVGKEYCSSCIPPQWNAIYGYEPINSPSGVRELILLNGDYQLIVYAKDYFNNESYDTISFTVDNHSDIEDINISDLRVYPNPTKDKLTISFGSVSYKNAVVEITDIYGRTIFSNNFHNTSTTTISLTGYPKGYYFLILIIDGEKINRRICLE